MSADEHLQSRLITRPPLLAAALSLPETMLPACANRAAIGETRELHEAPLATIDCRRRRLIERLIADSCDEKCQCLPRTVGDPSRTRLNFCAERPPTHADVMVRRRSSRPQLR